MSTLAFGSRVSEITLGRASRNCQSSAIFEARQAALLCASFPEISQHCFPYDLSTLLFL